MEIIRRTGEREREREREEREQDFIVLRPTFCSYGLVYIAVEGLQNMHIAGTADFLTGKGRATSTWYDTRPRSLAFYIKKNKTTTTTKRRPRWCRGRAFACGRSGFDPRSWKTKVVKK